MCDCTLAKENENVNDKRFATTATIFDKCTVYPVQRESYASGTRQSTHAFNTKHHIPTSLSAAMTQGKINGIIASGHASSSDESSDSMDNIENHKSTECVVDCEDNLECVCNGECYNEESDVEHTLVMISSEDIENLKAIQDIIFSEGFEVLETKRLRLTPEQASEFYVKDYGATELTHFVTDMTSGPLVVAILANKQAIQKWQLLMGPAKVTEARQYFPDSIRAQYGTKSSKSKLFCYGSTSRKEAARDIRFFFPEFIVEPLLKGQSAENYLREIIYSFLAKGLAVCCKEKPVEPILWLANWLLSNNPNVPKLILKNESE